MRILPPVLVLAAIGASACTGMPTSPAPFSQDGLPEAVRVGGGHQVAMETVGTGDIAYECREDAKSPGQAAWTFVGPEAMLADRSGRQVGRYFGPPATWEALDGSKITATQVAVSPAGAGNLPYQLVKANAAVGQGAMTGVTYVQRVALRGGVAPSAPCAVANKGERRTVPYQADYIFWKAR